MASPQQQYGPNWRDVQDYHEAIPEGSMLHRLGKPNEMDQSVRRLNSWTESESVVRFDPDNGSPDNSACLRFQSDVCGLSARIQELARQTGLAQMVELAAKNAGARYASDTEDFSDEFFDWCDAQPETCSEWYGNHIQGHAYCIGEAIALGRRSETEVLWQMWYWHRAGHWPCGWEGDWPD